MAIREWRGKGISIDSINRKHDRNSRSSLSGSSTLLLDLLGGHRRLCWIDCHLLWHLVPNVQECAGLTNWRWPWRRQSLAHLLGPLRNRRRSRLVRGLHLGDRTVLLLTEALLVYLPPASWKAYGSKITLQVHFRAYLQRVRAYTQLLRKSQLWRDVRLQ